LIHEAESIRRPVSGTHHLEEFMHLISEKIAQLIENHSEMIVKRWLEEIRCDQAITCFDDERIDRIRERLAHSLKNLREWIGYDTVKEDIGRQYASEGTEYFKNGIPLCEIVRSFELLKKTVRSFSINECSIESTFELYQTSELNERFSLFMDRVLYYVMRGYEEAMNSVIKTAWHLTDDDTDKIFFKNSFYQKRS